ncbi:MAG TPA: hypothetical protein PKO33_09755, partial [Pyrinomonadaceae bacterium]|nr:hypothetical protein [Pyrinomonadaceae bacterium]
YNCVAAALGYSDRWIESNGFKDSDGNTFDGGGYRVITKRDTKGNGITTDYPLGISNPEPYSTVRILREYGGAKPEVKVDKNTTIVASADSVTPDGYYKIVVFEGKNSKETHVMWQERNGSWSSKNGRSYKYSGIGDPVRFYDKYYSGHSPDIKPVYLFRKIK